MNNKKKHKMIVPMLLSGLLVFSVSIGNTGFFQVHAERNKVSQEIHYQKKDFAKGNLFQNLNREVVQETEILEEMKANEAESNKMEHTFYDDVKLQAPINPGVRSGGENTDPNHAYLVSDNTVTQGMLANNNEFRWYAFELEKKSKVSILLQMIEGLDADLYIFSLNQETSTLELVGGSATEGTGVQEFYNDVLEAGIYFFSIAGYEGTGNFAFAFYESSVDVDYEINDYLENATEVSLSSKIIGVIDNPSDWDYYKFTVKRPTILRYSISTSNGYSLGYAGGTGSTPVIIDGTMIKVRPGTYYFAVYSANGTYSSSSTYSVEFKKIGEYVDENKAPLRAIDESCGIVFQTNLLGTDCYVNGNPIDISYEYHFNASNAGGLQDYNITLSNMDGVYCQIWDEELQGPDVVYYHSSTRPYRDVGSKNLLRLMFYADKGVNFYRIMCRGTGAYSNNTLFLDPNYVIVLIDPDTGELVDIAEFNYFYDFAPGSNKIVYSGRHDMAFDYSIHDYID